MSDPAPSICTIATADHRPQVACMLESYLRHHPGGRAVVLHVDDAREPEPGLERSDIIHLALADLRVPGLAAMRARYSRFELCNALKPFLLRHVFETTSWDRLCYGDGDLFFFDALYDGVWDALATDAVLLTPHLVDVPSEDPALAWRDLAILRHGTYNAGFLALRRDAGVDRLLRWWGDRTSHLGQKKLEEGLNCDQRWLDLVTGFDLGVHVARHPGLNAAYWNLHERRFTREGGCFFANGRPLLFFHFSGYSPDRPDRITRHYTAFDFEKRPDLRPIFEVYRAALQPTAPTRRSSLSAPMSPPSTDVQVREVAATSRIAVSVVIPARNAGRHLATAIDSVLAQTLHELEVVVVDDGSSDDTAAVAQRFVSSDPRVTLIRQPQAGVSAARNRGIEAARGRYVAFLDADDWFLLATKLADQAALLDDRSDLGIAHSGWREVDAMGTPRADCEPWRRVPVLDLEGWLLWQPALPSAMMVRRQAIVEVGGFDVRLRHLEDLDVALRLTLAGHASAWLEAVTVAYRRHDSNASRRLAQTEEDMHAVLDRFFARPELPPPIRALAPRARAGAFGWLAERYARQEAYADMARVLQMTLAQPSGPQAGAALLAWLEDFDSHLREQGDEALDVYTLTSRPEWQALVLETVIGQPLDRVAAPRRQAGGMTVAPWVGPVRQEVHHPTSEEAPTAHEPKLDLSGALAADYGRHRSGWAYAMRSLLPLHRDGGVWVDAFPEHTFNTEDPTTLRSHTRPWIGFLHNPANMPEWFVFNQSPQWLLANDAFQASLSHCQGLFSLSEHHARWWRERVGVPVAVVRLPTDPPSVGFSLERFVANPRKRVVQIGAWLRKLHSIYYLPVRRLQRAIAHQHRHYIDDLMAQERRLYRLQPDEAAVEVLPFMDDAAYDEMLAGNLAYMELYDSSANNVIVECLARATPVLVNPLPAVVEYLGADYPFYFTSRGQAARKAEDIAAIEDAHHYLAGHPLRAALTGSAFAQAVATSLIYGALDA